MIKRPMLMIPGPIDVADDPALSEERWIDLVGSHLGATVHKVRAGEQGLLDDLKQLVRQQGEPFGSTSIYAQHLVFREAHRNGVKVLLDGQGADELLGGYTVYQAARLASLVSSGRLREAYAYTRRVALQPVSVQGLHRDIQAGLCDQEWLSPIPGMVAEETEPP